MNRLQKKCVIATVGIHLLLLLVLLFGSAFFSPRPKPDDTQLLDVIPSNLIDAAFNSGVRNATPPAPAPVMVPPPQPAPAPPTIQPAPQPPAPKPIVPPPPTLMDKVADLFKPEPKPEPAKPTPEKTEPQPHKIQINTQLVTRSAPENSATKPQPNTKALLNTALTALRKNLSSPTEVNLPGDSTVAYANYGDVVVSVYHNAWVPPDGMDSASVTVQFKVTIASDGTVISARIVSSSGDANVDSAVQRMLDRVTVIAPFPEGATEKERNYTINFNATRTTE
jgi:protein TonB